MMFVPSLVLVLLSSLPALLVSDTLPACRPEDFHYEYTECDSEGGRWRVSVPKPGACIGGAPAPPERGKGCDFTCEAGQYLDLSGAQDCLPCPAGTYSLGGGVRFDDWDAMPSGFSVELGGFTGPSYFVSHDDTDANCTGDGWVPSGHYVSSVGGECSASLVYTANLVTAGVVTFTYQFTDKNSMFHFQVQNSQCQRSRDRGMSTWPKHTDEGEWNTVRISLTSGLNVLYWKSLYVGESTNKQMRKPIRIQSVEITGIAYTSECMKCRPGSFSDKGASYCEVCGTDTFSDKGAAQCTPCDAVKQYADRGSSECKERPACTDEDYFSSNSACDKNNVTKKMYQWVEPRICRDDVPGAKQLPLSGEEETCPPCNPGMALRNGSCEFCKSGSYSDGYGLCEECPASTAPKTGLVYKWWNSIPPSANISTYCLSLSSSETCSNEGGWQPALDHIHSGKGHADDAYLVLILKVAGFHGTPQVVNGLPVPLAEVTFVFSMECTQDCSFLFTKQGAEELHGTTLIEAWEGIQPQQQYTYRVLDNEPVSFVWAFQKQESVVGTDARHTYALSQDRALIYSINVTNTVQGGASSCKKCPKGAGQEGCIPCPTGQYVSRDSSECRSCPHNTIVDRQAGDACLGCGEGLHTADNVKCETTCKYRRPDGLEYDFTGLSGVQTLQGTRLFTSGGTQYYHMFNMSLCGGSGNYPQVTCSDNITYPMLSKREATQEQAPSPASAPSVDVTSANATSLGVTLINSTSVNVTRVDSALTDMSPLNNQTESMFDVVQVKSLVCRTTIIPPLPGEDGMLAAQPVSLGDVLVRITSNHSSLNMKAKMEEEGFDTDGMDLDVHFVYASESPTAACPHGRTTVLTLRCDPTAKGRGSLQAPPKCSDGTCDGCHFHFVWSSSQACPLCKAEDVTMVKAECVDGQQTVTLLPTQKHCLYLEDSKGTQHTQTCTVKWPLWLTVVVYVVPILGVLGVLLIVLLCYCWMHNKSLEYKYMKLVASSSGGHEGELPAAETCALDEDDDDEEEYDAVRFKDTKGAGKGGKLFSKFKLAASKKNTLLDNLKAAGLPRLLGKGKDGRRDYADLGSDGDELFSEEEVNNLSKV